MMTLDNELPPEPGAYARQIDDAIANVPDVSEAPVPANRAQAFVLAGRAIFTIRNRQTGNRFTYKVHPSKDGNCYFVSLLTGPENTTDYRYLGILDRVTGAVRLTRKSSMSISAPAVKAIQWAMPRVWAQSLPAAVEFLHAGKCGRCGRTLTVPESIASGFGPECLGKVEGF